MNYQVNDHEMLKKVDRIIHKAGNLYELDDIMDLIDVGKMQSFTYDNTWVVTQIQVYPRKKVLEIVWVIGFMEDAVKLLPEIEQYAKEKGASRIRGIGREGWWKFAEPGWKQTAVMYEKDI